MNVKHRLAGLGVAVHDDTVAAIGVALLARDGSRPSHQRAHQAVVGADRSLVVEM